MSLRALWLQRAIAARNCAGRAWYLIGDLVFVEDGASTELTHLKPAWCKPPPPSPPPSPPLAPPLPPYISVAAVGSADPDAPGVTVNGGVILNGAAPPAPSPPYVGDLPPPLRPLPLPPSPPTAPRPPSAPPATRHPRCRRRLGYRRRRLASRRRRRKCRRRRHLRWRRPAPPPHPPSPPPRPCRHPRRRGRRRRRRPRRRRPRRRRRRPPRRASTPPPPSPADPPPPPPPRPCRPPRPPPAPPPVDLAAAVGSGGGNSPCGARPCARTSKSAPCRRPPRWASPSARGGVRRLSATCCLVRACRSERDPAASGRGRSVG